MSTEVKARSSQFGNFLSRLFVVAILVGMLTTAHSAQAEPIFTADATQSCVSQATANYPALSGYAVLDCIGSAATVCMRTPGGDTTIGMMTCLEGELKFWDTRLNHAYGKRVAAAKAQDAEMRGLRSSAASIEKSLRAMQRAWMSFRDASCLYEQAQWMGGTGGGPATLACHMHETARQSLKLEGWWSQ